MSVYFWLKDKFPESFINVVDGFPEGDLVLPTVAVELGRTDVQEFELGNRDGLRVRRWYIDIYAINKSQRDEFGYRLLNELKNGIPVYNYDEGFPPSVSPSRIGTLIVLSKMLDPVRINSLTTQKLYYRATVAFVAQDDVTEV